MDAQGIDQAVLYPATAFSASAREDADAVAVAAAASNDRMASYCTADPRRLFGAAAVALSDPAVAARELRRAVMDLNLVAAFVDAEQFLTRAQHTAAYDVVWEAAAALDVPLCTRTGPGLLSSGVLERHPGLRVLLLGAGSDWSPPWPEHPQPATGPRAGTSPRPTERLTQQCGVSFAADERLLPAALPFVGREGALWGSGGRRHEAALSEVGDAIRATVAPCATADQVRVLGLNARRFYGLPSRHTGLAGLVDDYFTAVTAQEIDLVRALFAPDAVFESGHVVLEGLHAICDYYVTKTFTYSDFRPAARTPIFEGTTIHVDIDVHIGGTQNSVHDVFETDGHRITALRVSGFEEALGSARSRRAAD